VCPSSFCSSRNLSLLDVSAAGMTGQKISAGLKNRGDQINPIDAKTMGAVTHYDVTRDQCLTALEALREVVAAG